MDFSTFEKQEIMELENFIAECKARNLNSCKMRIRFSLTIDTFKRLGYLINRNPIEISGDRVVWSEHLISWE